MLALSVRIGEEALSTSKVLADPCSCTLSSPTDSTGWGQGPGEENALRQGLPTARQEGSSAWELGGRRASGEAWGLREGRFCPKGPLTHVHRVSDAIHSSHTLVKQCSKFSKPGFSNM